MFDRLRNKLSQPRGARAYETISARTGDPAPDTNWIRSIFSGRSSGNRKSNRRLDDEGPAPMPQLRGMQGMLKDLELAVQRGIHSWNMTQMKDAMNSMEFFYEQVKDNYEQLARLKDQQTGKPSREEQQVTQAQVDRVLEKDNYSHGYGRLNEGVAPDQTEVIPINRI